MSSLTLCALTLAATLGAPAQAQPAPVVAPSPASISAPAPAPLAPGIPQCDGVIIIDGNYRTIKKVCAESPTDDDMRDRISVLMEGFVDFPEFGQLALGKYWDTLSEKQRGEYLDEFKKLLKRTYLRRFTRGQDFNFSYRSGCSLNAGGDRMQVQTTIKSGETEVDVDYRFHKKADRWQVYDLVVDEVSVMRNYRTNFVRILKNEGFEALLKKMREKTSSSLNKDDEI
jgi:phospholipid transport system substrate-binding protein